MRHILWGFCLGSGGLLACSSGVPLESGPVSGEYVPSSAEHAPESAAGNEAPIREGEFVADYAERPQAERWCWFVDGEADESVLYEIDMDSGQWGMRRQLTDRPLTADGNCFTLHGSSLVWLSTGTISALDLTTDELVEEDRLVEVSRHVASNGSEFLGSCNPALCAYSSVAALLADTPDSAVPGETYQGWVLAYVGDAFYTAESVGEYVHVYERATGQRQRTLLLAGREELAERASRQPVNQGLTVVGDQILVHDGGGEGYIGGDSFQGDERGTRLDTYDAASGEHLESLFLGRRTIDPTGDINPRGLVCGGAF